MKLYPPKIDSIIPASCIETKNEQLILNLPFTMNVTVAEGEFKQLKIKIKSINNNNTLYTGSTITYTNNTATFIINDFKDKIQSGQYYKIQLAYVDNTGVIGYYSQVGIIKFCKSIATTVELKDGKIIGTYKSEDSREKIYKYRFKILNSNKETVFDSKELLHNINNDTSGTEAQNECEINLDLNNNIYYLEYIVKTTNGLEKSTDLIPYENIDVSLLPMISLNLIATNITEQGYIDINITDIKNYEFGHFILKRTDDTSNFKKWNDIISFDLAYTIGNKHVWKDYIIEDGKTYQYAIQQYNEKIKSENILSNKVMASFEDMFLFDSNKQLNIKFNPTISSFKENILEQKVETIGNKYPYFFRNGNVRYKEIGISGLISYVSDVNGLFLNGLQLNILEDTYKRKSTPDVTVLSTVELGYNTNLSEANIRKEKTFREAVLDWLNNGKIKCFKSPTEGNLIVRLMNVSLSPEEKLGRMIYSFSATAIEVDTYNLANAVNLFFKDIKLNYDETSWKRYTEKTFLLKNYQKQPESGQEGINIIDTSITKIKTAWFQDILPGTKFIISFVKNEENGNIMYFNNSYIINNTGALFLATQDNEYITQICYIKNTEIVDSNQVDYIQVHKENEQSNKFILGQITIGYYHTPFSKFNSIKSISLENRFEVYLGQQWVNDTNTTAYSNNLMNYINTYCSKIKKIYAIQFRQSDQLYKALDELEAKRHKMSAAIYQQQLKLIKKIYTGSYIINDQVHILNNKKQMLYLGPLENITNININKYVNMDIVYCVLSTTYSVDNKAIKLTYNTLKQKYENCKDKENYTFAINNFKNLKEAELAYNNKIQQAIEKYTKIYDDQGRA